mmetsp:Transcript_13370/g.31348  ORF Transcript_13370/g.31348 Transcript_13370/m.31348 type:complete len:223 (+) Transcript_13370:86-754(+)
MAVALVSDDGTASVGSSRSAAAWRQQLFKREGAPSAPSAGPSRYQQSRKDRMAMLREIERKATHEFYPDPDAPSNTGDGNGQLLQLTGEDATELGERTAVVATVNNSVGYPSKPQQPPPQSPTGRGSLHRPAPPLPPSVDRAQAPAGSQATPPSMRPFAGAQARERTPSKALEPLKHALVGGPSSDAPCPAPPTVPAPQRQRSLGRAMNGSSVASGSGKTLR